MKSDLRKKLSETVKAVILSFSHNTSSMSKIQESMKLPLSPPKPEATGSKCESASGSASSIATLPLQQPAADSASEIYKLYGYNDLPKIKRPRLAVETVECSPVKKLLQIRK